MDPGPVHRRRRPAIACTECRRRKVSCDLASPCGPCQKSRTYLRCIYNNNNSNNNAGHKKKRGSSTSTESFNNIENANRRRTHTRGSRSASEFSSRSGSGDIAESISSGSVTTCTSFPQSNQSLSSAPKVTELDHDLLYMDSAALDMTLFSGVGFLGMDQLGYREPPFHPKPALSLPEMIWDASKTLESSSMFSSNQFSLDLEQNWNAQPSTALHLAGQPSVSQPPDARWLGLDAGRDVVRHLLRKYTRAASEDEESGHPQDGIARPLMDILAKLEQTALKEHENEAATTLNVWPRPSSLDLTASAAKRLLPSRAQCDVLVKTYINTFESVLSIVHVPSFLQEYERLWETGTVMDETFICNLLLIVTLGSYTAPRPFASYEDQSALRSQTTYWVTFVKHWTTQQMVSGYRASIGTAQTMCLMALTKLVLPQHSAGAGTNLLLGDHDLTRIGIQIGLHRKPTANMSKRDGEIHRGLWATMLELSLQHCLDKGHPAPLTPASYDCEPPSGITEGKYDSNRVDEDGHDEGFRPGSNSTGVGKLTIVEMLTKTQKLRIQVLDVLNAPSSTQAYDSSHQLAAEINEICNTNMATLQRRPPSTTRDFQMHMLDMFTRPFVIALHCPFADQASATNPTYYYSRIMRMELSALLLAHPCSPESLQHDDSSIKGVGSATPSSASSYYWQRQPPSRRTTTYDLMAHSNIDGINMGGSSMMKVDPGAETTSSSSYTETDVCSSLLLQGHGFYAHARRQATAALFLDLISELEEQAFPTLQAGTRQRLREVLRNVVHVFKRRVICAGGSHSMREFVLFSAAAAYVDGLVGREQASVGGLHGAGVGIGFRGDSLTLSDKIERNDVDGAVTSAAAMALTFCAEAVEQKGLSTSSSSTQSVNLSPTGH